MASLKDALLELGISVSFQHLNLTTEADKLESFVPAVHNLAEPMNIGLSSICPSIVESFPDTLPLVVALPRGVVSVQTQSTYFCGKAEVFYSYSDTDHVSFYYRKDGGTPIKATQNPLVIKWDALDNSSNFSIEMAAKNAGGFTAWTAPKTFKRLEVVVDALVPQSERITVNFSYPDGVLPVFTGTLNGASLGTIVSPLVLTGLTPLTPYTLDISYMCGNTLKTKSYPTSTGGASAPIGNVVIENIPAYGSGVETARLFFDYTYSDEFPTNFEYKLLPESNGNYVSEFAVGNVTGWEDVPSGAFNTPFTNNILDLFGLDMNVSYRIAIRGYNVLGKGASTIKAGIRSVYLVGLAPYEQSSSDNAFAYAKIVGRPSANYNSIPVVLTVEKAGIAVAATLTNGSDQSELVASAYALQASSTYDFEFKITGFNSVVTYDKSVLTEAANTTPLTPIAFTLAVTSDSFTNGTISIGFTCDNPYVTVFRTGLINNTYNLPEVDTGNVTGTSNGIITTGLAEWSGLSSGVSYTWKIYAYTEDNPLWNT